MSESVLNLGEKILLASRLAAIEHVRQVMDEQNDRQQRLEHLAEAPADAEIDQSELLAKWKGFYTRARQEAA